MYMHMFCMGNAAIQEALNKNMLKQLRFPGTRMLRGSGGLLGPF